LPYTIEWYKNDILISENSLSFNIVAQQNERYLIKITDSLQQIAYDSVEVIVNPLPLANAGADVSICQYNTTQIYASGGVSYLWSTGTTAPYIYVNPILTTIYTVTVADVNGCTDSDEVVVFVAPIPFPQITASPSNTVCAGSKVILTGSGGVSYVWSTNNSYNQNVNPLTVYPQISTQYTLMAISEYGCSATNNVYISVTPNNIQAETKIYNHGSIINSQSLVCIGDTIEMVASGGDSYQWNSNYSNIFIGNTNSDTARAIANGNWMYFFVNISNSDGCSAFLIDTVHRKYR